MQDSGLVRLGMVEAVYIADDGEGIVEDDYGFEERVGGYEGLEDG